MSLLLGHTPNRIRIIGEEPKNKVLLYNLGCNGIGIIPSVLGGRKISRLIAGENLKPSIFDPRG
jgi:glycine/D-amino acid oxidase-like deaminating enzyme